MIDGFLEKSRKIRADKQGKFWILVNEPGTSIDEATLFELRKRDVIKNSSAFIKKFIAVTVQDNTPIPRAAATACFVSLNADICRAVAGECIIPFRPLVEAVRSLQVRNEESSRPGLWNFQTINTNLFALPIIGA